ncbi:hypothetical protein [Winogradskyella thalassocola]|uniref:Uncharacterized protein n=1 Tax=Winogradskyella thalassocola TaxID=262004 RepID=A0A1G8KR74_9FLAO|nr:hypothetical protein [Winogradskyella thalassocola]SDI45981.1 hypothetical protein SAMN04489796_11184 [Winogradskyella thalassocola]
MEDFLRRIKLIDTFSTTLNVSRSEFISALRNNVDEADIDSIFSGAFEVFTSSKNLYKGNVNHNGFRIRKRKRFFEKNIGKTIATGNLREQGETLFINTQIKGWNNSMFLFYGFLSVFYLIFIVGSFANIFSSDSAFPIFVPIFILIHALFMFGIPYFMMRRSVKRLKEDLDREFHYIISKSSSLR